MTGRVSLPASPTLARDERGATLIEFGLIFPTVAALLVLAFDVGHTLYVRSILEGAVQKAARDSGLETGTEESVQARIDDRVRAQLLRVGIRDSDITIARRRYQTFSAAAADPGEPFTDTNRNGRCDNVEPFEDINGNRTRDTDSSASGQGGAKDTVIYTVRLDYKHLFPIDGFFGVGDGRATMIGTTVMNNQPYGEQAAPVVRNCPAS
jgi:Flp pilus assembly pilin Flp